MKQSKIVLRPTGSGSTVYRRRQPLLHASSSSWSSTSGRMAEVAGGTTAECAAVWCCCPCSLVNLLVLVVYKVPAGICKKALRMRRRKQMFKKGLLPLPSSAPSSRRSCECKCTSHHVDLDGVGNKTEELMAVVVMGGTSSDENINITDKELMQLEEEMWERFYSTGFWRSPSQREKEREQQQQ